MNIEAGIPLRKSTDFTPNPVVVFRPAGLPGGGYVPTHRAYPVEYDAAREAVTKAARRVRDLHVEGGLISAYDDAMDDLSAALDALAAAGSEAS